MFMIAELDFKRLPLPDNLALSNDAFSYVPNLSRGGSARLTPCIFPVRILRSANLALANFKCQLVDSNR